MSKNLTIDTINDLADHLQTSWEIIEAIDNTSDDVMLTWMNPTEQELLAIWVIVTKNGLISSKAFTWGSFGTTWAANVEMYTPETV